MGVKFDVLLRALRESDLTTVRAEHVFADSAARDTYFSTDPNHAELITGLEIISGGEIERWASITPATSAAYSNIHWTAISGAALTASEIKALYESNAETNALIDSKLSILNHLTEDASGITSDVDFNFPPGSIRIGDAVIESGGRIVSAKSETTGNQGSFMIQLFDDVNYSKATVVDHTQVSQTFQIQTSSEGVISPNTEINFRQVVQNSVHFHAIRFKPAGGSVTQDFTFDIRLSSNGRSSYADTITPANVLNQGNGVFEFSLENPVVFDSGFSVYITINGISLLGGSFDGTDGARFGDVDNGNFFPWLESRSIPIIRHDIATENYVDNHSNLFTDDERSKLNSIENGAEVNINADWNATSGDSEILNKPTILNPIPSRTDEEIKDIVGAMVSGNTEVGIVVSYNNGLGKLNFVVTGSGGGTPPPANADIIYYGLSNTNNPSVVDVLSLTSEENPTNPNMINTGVSTAGDYFILLIPMNDDISTIFDTVLNQDVTDVFMSTDNVRILNSESYKSYVIGPLNANVDEQYVINF